MKKDKKRRKQFEPGCFIGGAILIVTAIIMNIFNDKALEVICDIVGIFLIIYSFAQF